MAELHVRNLPPDLHDYLRARAAAQGRSMSAEVVAILRAVLEPGEQDRRRAAIGRLREIQAQHRLAPTVPPAEQLVRDDRDRRSSTSRCSSRSVRSGLEARVAASA